MRRVAVLLALLCAAGCQPKLPGPLECEEMTFAVLGRTPAEVAHSPKMRRLTDRLVHGCLTVPFDKPAVACAKSGHSFLRCVDDLARRAPERTQALRALVADLDHLGQAL